LKREYPDLRVVGEVLEGNPALVSFFQGGRARFDQIDSGIDTLFDFPLYFALRRVFGEGKPLVEVAAMLAQDWLYADAPVLVTLLGLHDVPRFMSVTGATPEGLKLAFTFLMTTRGTPLIYYGDEIGMKGGSDPDNRRDFPGGWKGDARNAFEAGGRSPEENALWSHVRTLTQLRRELQALRTGRLLQLFAVGQQYAYARVLGASAALVVLNNDATPTTVEFSLNEFRDGEYADRTGGAAVLYVRSGRARVGLSGRCGAVFVK
jgi:glycosidase